MRILLIACLSVSLSVAAQFLLKAGVAHATVRAAIEDPLRIRSLSALLFRPEIVLGFLLYGLGALAWLAVLARWDVSKAYPLVGMGFIGSVAIGLVLGEQVTPARIVGVLLICAGVALVART
jgi:drug/metabolite transporter (DMT)-like permease